ncbi:MAG TPA: ABC transporter permease [Trueperaceae bacterium]|nr:ABC transporter permease [Trueperaceae bacterium]
MFGFVVRRLFGMLLVMFIVGIIVFIITRAVPGDPIAIMLGEQATPEDIERMRGIYGLDQPLPVQFVLWLKQLASGNLGTSIFFSAPVSQLLIARAEPTALLSAVALTFAVTLGLPAGLISAARPGGLLDRALLGVAMIAAGVPSFWLGLVLMQYLAVKAGWFPVAGYGPPEATSLQRLPYLVLPGLALALPNAALLARMTRSSMLEVASLDYVRTAMAKGLAPRTVFLKHAFRNALITVITVIGVIAAVLLSGVVVVETVFSLPGLGQLVMSAVLRRDYPVIQGALIIVAGIYVLVNLIVDILYGLIDPRVSYAS